MPLITVAALNRQVVKPRLGHEERARRLLPWLLGAEAALGLGVLLLTATLTQLPPAHPLIGTDTAAANPALSTAKPMVLGRAGALAPNADVSSSPGTTQTAQRDGFTTVLQTTTGRDGGELAVNVLLGTGGAAAAQTQLPGVQEVYALVTFAGADLGQTNVPLSRHADGWYRARQALPDRRSMANPDRRAAAECRGRRARGPHPHRQSDEESAGPDDVSDTDRDGVPLATASS